MQLIKVLTLFVLMISGPGIAVAQDSSDDGASEVELETPSSEEVGEEGQEESAGEEEEEDPLTIYQRDRRVVHR